MQEAGDHRECLAGCSDHRGDLERGGTANCIAPALIETEIVTSNPRASPGLIPVGRFGATEEVADVVVTLATTDSITGQTINVNGGWYTS